MGLYFKILNTFGINTFSTTVPTKYRHFMWYSFFTFQDIWMLIMSRDLFSLIDRFS